MKKRRANPARVKTTLLPLPTALTLAGIAGGHPDGKLSARIKVAQAYAIYQAALLFTVSLRGLNDRLSPAGLAAFLEEEATRLGWYTNKKNPLKPKVAAMRDLSKRNLVALRLLIGLSASTDVESIIRIPIQVNLQLYEVVAFLGYGDIRGLENLIMLSAGEYFVQAVRRPRRIQTEDSDNDVVITESPHPSITNEMSERDPLRLLEIFRREGMSLSDAIWFGIARKMRKSRAARMSPPRSKVS